MKAEVRVDFAGAMAKKREAAARRFEQIAEVIAREALVEKIVYEDRGLRGRALVRHGGERKATIWVPRPTTRRRLYIFAHECGHVALDHDDSRPAHRQEYEAERWAIEALRSHGVPVPLKEMRQGKKYVAMKIDRAVRRRAKQIDRESYRFCEDYLSPEVRRWFAAGGTLVDSRISSSS